MTFTSLKEQQRRKARDVRVVFNALLGGWYIVRGRHDTPLGGRFESKGEALAHLQRDSR